MRPADRHSLTSARTENAEKSTWTPTWASGWRCARATCNWVPTGNLAQMVIATDITPRRKQAEDAGLAPGRARRSSVSRLITMGEMASSVAHELNQPLTAINNYCSGMVSAHPERAASTTRTALLTALQKTAHQAQRAGQIIQRIRAVREEERSRNAGPGTMCTRW